MFCAIGLVFDGTEGVRASVHVLQSWTYFLRYRERPVHFLFCAPRLVFGGTEGSGTRFHVFALTISFSAISRATSSVFMFCAPGPCSTEGAEIYFRRYRGRQVRFACFTLPNPFAAVQRAPGLVFLFCATGCSTEGVGSSFHVLQSQTHFRRFFGRRVQFSYFKLPDSFWAVPRASGQGLMVCASEPFFDSTEGARSSFHVLAPRLILDGTEGDGYNFNVLRSQTHFGRY
jgi:hypothetical protein